MTDVKWIKLAADIFSNRKILQIEALPDGDSIIVIWVKLLCLAGNINDSGFVYFTKEVPYTEQMLATQFNRPLTTVQFALKTFEEFGMIEVIDNMLCISNWEKYQNVDGMERIREQTRLRVARCRERRSIECNVTSNATVTQCNATDIEEDKDKDKNIYQQIADMYNSICKSYPKVVSLSNARKKAIKARLNDYSVEDFKRMFEKAEESRFLKGGNDRNWQATFDWLIKDSNMAKVLDGNYDSKNSKKAGFNTIQKNDYDFDSLERALTGE